MKILLSLFVIFYSLGSFGQSFLVLNNGVVLTNDKSGFIYDFGHFVLPYQVNFSGGQFMSVEGKLVIVDRNGYLYRTDEKVSSKINGKGDNYFVDNKGTLYTFDSKGFFYKFSKESDIKDVSLYGGRFFIVKNKKNSFLYTLNSSGNFFKLNIEGLDPSSINIAGGNFFQTQKGEVFTISDEGFVFSKKEMEIGKIKKIGGRFFLTEDDAIYTVSKEGFLLLPFLPENLKVSDIKKLGRDFFITSEGKLYSVSEEGNIYERETKHNLIDTQILSF